MTSATPMTSDHFARWAAERGQAGDCVLFRPGRPGVVGWAIERCQRRMLADLAWLPLADNREAARHVHAAMICRSGQCVEQMQGHGCRVAPWPGRLAVGDRLLLRRPVVHLAGHPERDATPAEGGRAAVRALLDVGKRYPLGEILRYWLVSWGWDKLTMRRRFVDVFERKDADVCSDSYWRWCVESDLWPDIEPPEAIPAGHYPAELAINHRLRTIASVEIVSPRQWPQSRHIDDK